MDLEKRIYRIVHGQVRSYMNDHPEAFAYPGIKTKSARHRHLSIAKSIAKRIVPDILILLMAAKPGDGMTVLPGAVGGDGLVKNSGASLEVPSAVLADAVDGHEAGLAGVRPQRSPSVASTCGGGESLLVAPDPAGGKRPANRVGPFAKLSDFVFWR